MRDEIAELNRVAQRSSALADFAWYAKSLLAAQGRIHEASEFARKHHASPRLASMFKTAATPGVTAESTGAWGSELSPLKAAADGFISSLSAFSAFDRIWNDGAFRKVPLRTRIAVTTSAATGTIAGEAEPKPVSELVLEQHTLPTAKACAIVTISDELARSTSTAGTDLFTAELRRAVAIVTDEKFLSTVAGSAGVASHSSSGMTAANFMSDIATALADIDIGGGRLYLVLPSSAWATASLLRDTGGSLISDTGMLGAAIRVVPTSADTNDALLVDASAVAAGSETVVLDVAREAAIHMQEAPTDGAGALTSLWQKNLVALRAERFFGVELLRSTGASIITGVAS